MVINGAVIVEGWFLGGGGDGEVVLGCVLNGFGLLVVEFVLEPGEIGEGVGGVGGFGSGWVGQGRAGFELHELGDGIKLVIIEMDSS